jgi:VanZ family protein
VPLRVRRTLWLLFAAFVVYGTTIPFHFVRRLSTVEEKLHRIVENPMSPVGTPRDWSAPDILQNLLLFVPFGVLGIFAAGPDARSGASRIVVVTGLGAALGLSVEAVQLFTQDRVSSLIDAATDTLGAGLGAVMAHQLQRSMRGALGQMSASGWFRARAFYPVVLATAVVCLLAWVPFDVTLDIGMILPKVRMLARDVWQYNGLTDEGVAIVQFALLAIAVSEWLAEMGHRKVAMMTAAIVIGAAIGLEASQLIITSRMPSLEDVAVRAVGALIGTSGWAIGRGVLTPRLCFAVLILATGVAAFIHGMNTSEFLSTQRLYRLLNLRNYRGTIVPAFIFLTERMFIYAPVGFVVARGLGTASRAVAVAVLVAVAIAIPLEGLHAQKVEWSASIMNVAVSLAGAGLGAWAATVGAALFTRMFAAGHAARMGS